MCLCVFASVYVHVSICIYIQATVCIPASYNLLFELVRCCRKLRTTDSWAPRRKGEEAPAKHRNRLTHKVWTKRRAEEFLKRL